MLTIKEVDILELKKLIDIAFDGDTELIDYYDRIANVSSVDEMVNDTFDKIKDYENHFANCYSYAVMYDDKEIGYLFITKNPNLLISFSLNKAYRCKENLASYFSLIKSLFEDRFGCYLNTYNTRAINWLKKCEMDIVSNNVSSLITFLNLRICQ
jgi:hypothetical protein